MQSKLFAVRIATFGTHGISKENHAAVLISLWMIPTPYIPSLKIFAAMLFVDIIGRNRRKLCGMSTSDARNVVESLALLTEGKHITAKNANESILFFVLNMILCFQTPKQDGCFL
jgi:hypothetical protein